jgi:hypothetical protein
MRFIAIVFVVLMLAGCSFGYPWATLYTDTKMGVQAAPGSTAKTGKACLTSIIGIATGDASIEAAKKAGGITNVATINYEVKNILGVYGEYCTVVKGN